jgi:TPR repeat protein
MAGASHTRVAPLAQIMRAAAVLCASAAFCSVLIAQGSKGFEQDNDAHNSEPGRRLALVIGNKDYPWKPLANPVNDATDVADSLEKAGFKGNVQRVFNAPHDAMKRAVRDFVASVHPGDFAFVYYSGHGVEVKGINYLLPIDIPANATEDEVEDDGVSAQRIASDLDDHGAAVKVIVLDACRDNPIKASRSAGGGLAPMEGLGSLIVFATEAGRTASDNSANRNGLFTQYLLKALTAKGVSLDDAVRDVSRQMAQDTNRQQVPAIYGLLERPVYLFIGPVTISVATGAVPPDPALEAWNRIRDSKDPLDYDDFITAFPQSPYAPTAHLAANRLRREAAAASRANAEVSRTGNTEALFTLVVNCNLACTWNVDGKDQGTVQPGGTGRAQVAPGDHVLVATAIDGDARTSQTVTGAPGASKFVTFSLQPVHRDNRPASVKVVADRGLTEYNQKDYAPARTDFQSACSQGDLPSCRYLAYMYEFAVGVPQNYIESKTLLRKGCDGGDMTSCHNLANMYQYGKGVMQDYRQAASLFERACNGGELHGCGGLAFMYLNGLGVTKDLPKSAELYKQACDGGELQSCSNLAANYLSAQGVPQDDQKALALFKTACDGSIPAGCDGLAYMYRYGRAVAVDLAKAHQLYQQACNAGFDSSCKTLVKTVADRGLASYNQKDYANAQTDFQSACSQGDMPSCRYLAYMYEFAVGVPQDYLKSVSLLEKGCDGGEMTSCNNLANMYRFGKGVPLDNQKASSFFQKSCIGGEAIGCGGLAYMYLSGLGVTKDVVKSSQLYKQACDGGDLLSCSNLAANYLSSYGVSPDDAKAAALFKQACDGTVPAGCDGLAYMYRYGRGVPADLAKSHQLYQQACTAGFDSSCKTLTSFTGR